MRNFRRFESTSWHRGDSLPRTGFPVKIRVGETQFRKSRKNLHETPIDSLSLVGLLGVLAVFAPVARGKVNDSANASEGLSRRRRPGLERAE